MENFAGLNATLAGIFGLLIGSFLNVVIYRFPRMLEMQWQAEATEFIAATAENSGAGVQEPIQPRFNLAQPRSRCQSCDHQLRWFENLPLLSYVALRGKCSVCKAAISVRYPLVELLTGALFAYCAYRFDLSTTGVAWAFFCAMLLAMAFIDWDTTLLPDDLTLPLMWAGLVASAVHVIEVPLFDSVIGAAAGYLSLWLIYWAFKLATGKEGMGYGDFKLFAALGAWFGWPALITLILLSSVVGAIVGLAMKFTSRLREGGYIPFGPFLVGAGLLAFFMGPQNLQVALFGAMGF